MTDPGERAMRTRGRLILGAIGLLSWVAGGIAAFASNNGGGAAALVAAGVLAGAVAAIGRWPTRVAVSGHEVAWDYVEKTVDDQIQVVQDDRPEAELELRILRQRLEEMHRTGQYQPHPAAEYDNAVANALRRVVHGGRLLRSEIRSRQVADFELVIGDRRIYIETKWRSDPRLAFRWDTLNQLTVSLPPAPSLLVITNSVDVTAARDQLSTTKGIKIRVVSWNDEDDDDEMRAAVSGLLAVDTRDAGWPDGEAGV